MIPLNRTLNLILLVTSIFLIATASLTQTLLRNLISNPSFEYTGRSVVRESPDEGWTFSITGENVTGHVTTSRSIDGFRSYLIRAENGTGVLESDPFGIERGEEYFFSFALFGDGNLLPALLWWSEDEEEKIIIRESEFRMITSEQDWEIVQHSVRPPRRADYASVRFTVSGGDVWIDDVRFR